MNDRLAYAGLGATAVACLALGIGLGWFIWGGNGRPEGPARAQRQPDASLVLERQPAAPEQLPPQPHVLPAGSVEQRRVSVTIQPTGEACPPVHLDLSLVRTDDGGSRVIASSPDGRITGGLDIPVQRALAVDEPRRWVAGVSYAGQRAWGVYLHRDVWRVHLGLEVNSLRDDDGGGSEARLLVGWTW